MTFLARHHTPLACVACLIIYVATFAAIHFQHGG